MGTLRNFMRIGALPMAATAMLAAAPATGGDDDEIAAILATVNGAKDTLVSQNMVISHVTIDRIIQGTDHNITRTMYANNAYTLTGVSGPGIRDLDMWVTDPNGRDVGSDVLLDNYPVVTVPRSIDGTYTMRLRYVSAEDGYNTSDERYFGMLVAFARRPTK